MCGLVTLSTNCVYVRSIELNWLSPVSTKLVAHIYFCVCFRVYVCVLYVCMYVCIYTRLKVLVRESAAFMNEVHTCLFLHREGAAV